MKPYKLFIFAGTTEGRELADFLSSYEVALTVQVATEYGASLLEEERYTIYHGRLDQAEIIRFLENNPQDLVVDATHPFAEIVTKNIHHACLQTGTPYLRVIRLEEQEEGIIKVVNAEEAVKYLASTSGTILLTTGSKTLEAFTTIPDYKERLYVRLLPMPENIQKCIALGFSYSRLIAMQGPFSRALNEALLIHTKASYLVTKASGKTGGEKEKIEASKALGVTVVLIERPDKEIGLTLEESKYKIVKLIEAKEQ